MLIFVTILLFILGIFLCFIQNKEINHSKKIYVRIYNWLANEKYNEYLKGIIATILGVTLAIILTNYDSNMKDCKETKYYLSVLDKELSQKEEYIDEMLLPIVEISPESIDSVLKEAPILPISSLEIILNNEPYASTLSIYTYTSLLEIRTELMQSQNYAISYDYSNSRKLYLSIMSNDIKIIHKIIEVELQYLNKEINEKELSNKINDLNNTKGTYIYNQFFDTE